MLKARIEHKLPVDVRGSKTSVLKLSIYFSLFFFLFEGLVNKILSASFWIPLSRLTYCAYLVHPIVIFVFLATFESSQAYSDVHFVSNM